METIIFQFFHNTDFAYSSAYPSLISLFDSANRSHQKIGRADHGMDLDAAHDLQMELFLAAPVGEARRLIRPLVEVISHPRSNFPDLECLRAFVFLAVSPLLETPRTDEPISAMDTSNTSSVIAFQNDEPIDWYPTVSAGYAAGFVLASFCRAVSRLESVPSSVLGEVLSLTVLEIELIEMLNSCK